MFDREEKYPVRQTLGTKLGTCKSKLPIIMSAPYELFDKKDLRRKIDI